MVTQQLTNLQIKRAATEEYDVLVIGAGATGAGVALDAVSRGKPGTSAMNMCRNE